MRQRSVSWLFSQSVLCSIVFTPFFVFWGFAPAADKQQSTTPTPADEKSLAEELKRVPAVEPHDALKTFELQRGFHLELVASEPDVADPVDACFDEEGRMYVAEMHGYPFSQEPTQLNPQGGGKKDACIIRLLEDTDGDGRMDKSTVFADTISWPTSVCCFRGGVFAMAPLHIYYFKDTDGDGKADVREIVYSGFSRSNVQGIANNLKWGLDNRIYGAGGRNGGEITHRGKPWAAVNGHDFCFDPLTEKIELVTGGDQFGLSMDDWGNRFVCNNSNHIEQVVFQNRYLARNPYFGVSDVVRTIAKEGAAAPVFRRSPAEPWRVVRTRRRVADPKYKGLPETERHATGFFTSATGVTIYRGDAYPPEFRGNAFIGDVGGNLIHRKTLAPSGATYLATRADQNVEFLTSTDTWFRPVNFVNAPDGTLMILDMYRETIEHPYSIPDDIKSHLDLESGDERGRIWRLVAPDMKPHAVKKMGKLSPAELVAELESPNGWNSETAQRLIYERQEKEAVAPLRQLLKSSKQELGRLHALWTLEGLTATTDDDLLAALHDASPGVREHALRIAERYVAKSPKLVNAILQLVNDDEYRVRLQLALTMGELPEPQRLEGLTRLTEKIGDDRDLRTALLTSAGQSADALSIKLSEGNYIDKPGAAGLMGELARIAGAKPDPQGAARVLASVAGRAGGLNLRQVVLRSLSSGLRQRGSSISKILADPSIDTKTRESVQAIFVRATVVAEDDSRTQSERTAAIRLLGLSDFDVAAGVLEKQLSPTIPQEFQLAAVAALSEQDDPRVANMLISPWKGYSPAVRREVIDGVLQQVDRVQRLLAAVRAGDIKPGEIERDKKQLLLGHPDRAVRDDAQKLFGNEASPDRAKIIADYQKALELKGDLERGKQTFIKKCSVCHKLGDVGHQVGPEIASVTNKSPADLLISILDPSREAQPNFTAYTVVTTAGTLHSGIITSETATSITLRRAEGKEDIILRTNIDMLMSSGLSLMPVGLEKEITVPEMADLLTFVKSIRPAASAPR